MKQPTKLKPWDPRRQHQRASQLAAAMRAAARAYFDESGVCLLGDGLSAGEPVGPRCHPPSPFNLREVVYSAMAFLSGAPADVVLANRILDKVKLSACDFSTMGLIEMLIRFPERLTPSNRQKLRDHIATQIEHIRKPHNSFIGGNDNFPAMATFIFCVGGELLGNRRAVQDGLDNLHALADLLGRRGFISEYNSPTYSGVTLHGLDETANHVRHPVARRLARQAAERVWLDVAAHWHPHIAAHAGPFSRAYHANSIAWTGLTTWMLWQVFGDAIVVDPLARVFGPDSETGLEARTNILPFCRAVCTGHVGTIHHIPDYIGELMFQKRYPFRVTGTAEYGSFHVGDYRLLPNGAYVHVPGRAVDFGADSVATTTFMQPDYALGTATKMFLSGTQTDAFFALWRRQPRVRAWGDVRSLFARYLVNDTRPEDKDSGGLLAHQGLTFAVQDDQRALVLVHPAGTVREKVRALRLALVLQELTGPIDEIWFGNRRLPNGDGESDKPDWIILRDGPVLAAFHPLAPTNAGRQVLLRSRQENGYRVISFYNREAAAPRDYGFEESQIIQNGFICELSTVRREGSPRAFLKRLRQAEISDSTLMESRRVRYRRGGRELLLWIDPARQSLKAAAVNNCTVGTEPLRIDSIDLKRVPLLGRGLVGRSLNWCTRIAARPAIPGLEGVGGRRVEN